MSRMRRLHPACGLLVFAGIVLFMTNSVTAADSSSLELKLRSRSGPGPGEVREKAVSWNPRKTALVVCDMWDDHWCRSAAARVGELAGPLNEVIREARRRGVLIIHAPSSVTRFYDKTPQRRREKEAVTVPTPVPLSQAERWGTTWCWPDPAREKALPIDDSDMGCDCAVKCTIREAWTRQISAIEIAPEDVITDHGQETWNVLAARGVDNVILTGVHLNMCVLGRPFGIRQMVRLGRNVALMRDMTDTMYDPRRRPFVSHFAGTDLVIEHVETFWCPTFVSTDLTGRPAFRFKDDPRRP
jgi:nicotinamidase-related amidase